MSGRHTRRWGFTLLMAIAALCGDVGCQKLLDDHPKVDVDFCGDYKGDDECCSQDDPCDLGDNQQCECGACAWDVDDCTMSWNFIDLCDDNEKIHIGLYEGEDQWEGLTLDEYGEEYTIKIECSEGEKVCYGAWAESGYWLWGCAENCSEYCEDCCYFCDYKAEVLRQLGC